MDQVTALTKREEKLVEAYNKLGVEPANVLQLPTITPILDQSFPNGVKDAVGFLRSSDHEDARRFLAAYDSLSPTDRSRLPIEAFCLASTITTKRLLGLIMEECSQHSDDASQLIAAVHHPDVVKATVASALTLNGKEDRKMLHLHKGFVPVPKNQTTIFSGGSSQHNQTNNANSIIQANQTNISPNEVGTIETKMSKITDRYNQRMGIAPVKEQEPIEEAEVIEEIVEETIVDAEWS